MMEDRIIIDDSSTKRICHPQNIRPGDLVALADDKERIVAFMTANISELIEDPYVDTRLFCILADHGDITKYSVVLESRGAVYMGEEGKEVPTGLHFKCAFRPEPERRKAGSYVLEQDEKPVFEFDGRGHCSISGSAWFDETLLSSCPELKKIGGDEEV